MKGYPIFISVLAVLACACDSDEISTVQSESFIKYYAPNRTNEGSCVCEIPGGGYALLGNTTTDQRGSEICLLFTDAFGNSIQDPKYYGKSRDDKGYCIKAAPGGGYIILGSTQDPVNRDKEVFLIRTDALGDTVWTRTFDQLNGDDEGKWFDFNSRGHIIMVGYAYDKTGLTGDIISKQIWIYYVDQDGNRVDSHIPITLGGESDVDEARFVQRIEGDRFLVTGISDFVNSPDEASFSFIVLIGSDFTYNGYIESLEFNTQADTGIVSDEANCLISEDINTLYLFGSRKHSAGNSDIYLCRFNRLFNEYNQLDPEMEWIQPYDTDGNSKASHMLMDENGIYLLSSSIFPDKSSTISLITTGLSGNDPVYLSIGGSSQLAGHTFALTADGGFIISATNTNRDITDISSMTLIKTKPGGKL